MNTLEAVSRRMTKTRSSGRWVLWRCAAIHEVTGDTRPLRMQRSVPSSIVTNVVAQERDALRDTEVYEPMRTLASERREAW